jgi:hypothetical protein
MPDRDDTHRRKEGRTMSKLTNLIARLRASLKL